MARPYRTIPALEKTARINAGEVEPHGHRRRHALVTGATGVLGPGLAAALLDAGWSVRILSRTPSPKEAPDGVEVRVGDITDASAVAAATESVTTVFHLAGLLHNPRPLAKDLKHYEAVNVGGARHVAEAARAQGARVIAFSTIAVYGATVQPADESTPIRPDGFYATTKAQAETLLVDSGAAVTVLRLAAVYGRRMKGNYQRLAEALRRRLFVTIGDGTNRRTLIHEHDVFRAAILAAERTGSGPAIYNVTDGSTHTMTEILGAMCAALGRPEVRLRIPATLASSLARAIGYGHVVDKYLENVEVMGDLIQKELGFAPKFDLKTGWQDALGEGANAR